MIRFFASLCSRTQSASSLCSTLISFLKERRKKTHETKIHLRFCKHHKTKQQAHKRTQLLQRSGIRLTVLLMAMCIFIKRKSIYYISAWIFGAFFSLFRFASVIMNHSAAKRLGKIECSYFHAKLNYLRFMYLIEKWQKTRNNELTMMT